MKTVQEEIKSIEAQFLEIERTSKILDLELESLRENDKRKKKETKQKKIFEITKRVDKLVPSNGILDAEKRVRNRHKLTEAEDLWRTRITDNQKAMERIENLGLKIEELYSDLNSDPSYMNMKGYWVMLGHYVGDALKGASASTELTSEELTSLNKDIEELLNAEIYADSSPKEKTLFKERSIAVANKAVFVAKQAPKDEEQAKAQKAEEQAKAQKAEEQAKARIAKQQAEAQAIAKEKAKQEKLKILQRLQKRLQKQLENTEREIEEVREEAEVAILKESLIERGWNKEWLSGINDKKSLDLLLPPENLKKVLNAVTGRGADPKAATNFVVAETKFAAQDDVSAQNNKPIGLLLPLRQSTSSGQEIIPANKIIDFDHI